MKSRCSPASLQGPGTVIPFCASLPANCFTPRGPGEQWTLEEAFLWRLLVCSLPKESSYLWSLLGTRTGRKTGAVNWGLDRLQSLLPSVSVVLSVSERVLHNPLFHRLGRLCLGPLFVSPSPFSVESSCTASIDFWVFNVWQFLFKIWLHEQTAEHSCDSQLERIPPCPSPQGIFGKVWRYFCHSWMCV